MRAITIREILEHAEKFEDQLAEYYTKISKETSEPAVHLLTDYMGRHQDRIKRALGKIPIEQMQHIMGIPLQYEPFIPGDYCFKVIKLPTNASAKEILDAAIEFDQCIVQMFHQISLQPVHRDVQEFFGNLELLEENDQLELKKLKVMFTGSV